MRWMQDRQNRRYAAFLGVFCLLLAAVFLISWVMQESRVRDSVLRRERTAASFLLEQGVSEGTVALAFKNTESMPSGEALLRRIGHTEELLPALSEVSWEGALESGLFLTAAGAALCILLWMGALCYLREREGAYENAARIVGQYAEGNFSERLAGGGRGALHLFFSRVDRLSTALQSKGESEAEAKVFLKDTISDISHQLKTPLAALRMYTEIISGEPEDTETVRTFAGKSEESLERMERLIRMLLRVTRLDAGSVQFQKQAMHAGDLAREACVDLTARAERENKEVIFEGTADTLIWCDREWTLEAVGNLVKNALDHTRAGGYVKLSWKETPAMARLRVEDNGSGILPQDIHHIFKRFYRSSLSSDTQGVGLGLPLVRSVVEGQGGLVSVESTPGEGTAFTISFPNAPADALEIQKGFPRCPRVDCVGEQQEKGRR